MRRTVFGAFEVCLVVVFAMLATWIVATKARPHLTRPVWFVDPEWQGRLTAKYGASKFSAGLEEYLVRDFFDDKAGGVFLDVGSSDAMKGSNTYRLERDFGWSGVAVDADAAVARTYAARSRTRFVLAFVAGTDEGTALLHRGEGGSSSGDRSFTEQFGSLSGVAKVLQRSLNSILKEAGVTTIDFLSMDIELSEPAALQGFNIESYRPRLVCIEAHRPTRQWILNYFARRGYVVIADYLQADDLNLWFRPLEAGEPGPIPSASPPEPGASRQSPPSATTPHAPPHR